MADIRPLVNIAGTLTELKPPNLIPTDILPSASTGLIDGGTPTTSPIGLLKIDFGSVS